MKIILKKPALHGYRNANHLEFHKESYRICLKHESLIRQPDAIDAYRKAVEQENQAFTPVRKSEFTEKKEQTDRRRDEIYIGIVGIVRSNKKHFNSSIRNSAIRIHSLLLNYGDLTNDRYNTQTVNIDSIITRLRSDEYINYVQTLGLVPWIDELESRNKQFKQYMAESMQEKVKKPKIKSTVARRITDEALRTITDRVTAQINLGNPDKFAKFVNEFNIIVQHYNTQLNIHLGRLHAKIDIAQADIEIIKPQPFTGKHVFVIPAVMLADDNGQIAELIFSEDFTLKYRNNVNPGTATIIINGTGKYKGEIITTFNIIENNAK
jgi:hypothetical protein